MLKFIRESKAAKFIAAFVALNLIFDLAAIRSAKAITGGPSQPEVQSFEPAGVNQMVEPFSGDFTYNIPLLDVGGYPVNLSYHSGVGMDQEASWTGLGWNINPGTINRNMRGLPDDFNGDEIISKFDIKKNESWGVKGLVGAELLGGVLNLSVGMGINCNTYKGYGYEQIINVGLSGGNGSKLPLTANLGLTGGSDGLSIGGNITLSTMLDKANKVVGNVNVGSCFSTTEGLKEVNFSTGLVYTAKESMTSSSTTTLGHKIDFTSPSYAPSLQMPMQGSNLSFSGKLGLTIVGLDGTVDVSGYYSSQSLYTNTETGKAYGYMYSSEGDADDKALLDFNREKDGSFTREKPFLPIGYMTYDVYSVTGQGIGGVYRPYLNSVGIVRDPLITNTASGGSLGVEIAITQLLKGGADIALNSSNSTSGRWTENNSLDPLHKFKETLTDGSLFESFHFKQAGEMSIETDEDFIKDMGGRELVRPRLQGEGFSVGVSGKLFTKGGSQVSDATIQRANRARRNQLIIPLTAAQAAAYGLEKQIKFSDVQGNQHAISRVSGDYKSHHISQITALQPNGTSYVYGIPAYNNKQTETSFNCSGLPFTDPSRQFVYYTAGVDDAVGNNKGTDGYFNQKTIPAYAHSYLLTAILSPDYIDCDTEEGPSPGDYGTYTHFSYTKIDGYKWKTPFDKTGVPTATYNPGLQTIADDKASYIEGTKELWYLKSIETRTHVALFYTSPRYDGKPNSGSAYSLKLDSIKLFAAQDLQLNGEANATPVKSVYFSYDYSLCKNVWNSNAPTPDNGKLTLREVSFAYGKSSKSRLNKYTFNYNPANPGYDPAAYDRWGNYKPFDAALPNNEFPYCDQNPASANLAAAVWNLTEIKLPSGGAINIDYESDDYAYVMNKRAMNMITLHSVSADNNPCTNAPDQKFLFDGNTPRLYLIFQKQPNVSVDEYFIDQNGNKMEKLFYRFNININKVGLTPMFETVSGYVEVDEFGACPSNSNYGYVKIKKVDIGDRECTDDVNPVSKAAWQLGQLYLMPQLSSNSSMPPSGAEALAGMLSPTLIQTIVEAFKGQNRVFRDLDRGKEVDLLKSMIRLYDPDYIKFGGGTRVKQITIADNWNQMQSEDGFTYGMQYDYTDTRTFADGSTRTISSGVASYEPIIGNEENPWRMPEGYVQNRKWIADRDFYCEYPMGESFIPAASVGYSKVTVSNIAHPGVTRHATGKTVYEFYTAREFPVFFDHSPLEHVEAKSNGIMSLLKCNVKNYVTAAQGFYIETNDMHGKPKSQYVYAEGDTQPLSGISYYYSVRKNEPQRLSNMVNVVGKDGKISTQTVAADYDLTIDAREQRSSTSAVSLNGNMASFLVSVVPWLVPTILGSYSNEKTKFNSVVTTKVVNCYAIQDSTVAFDLGSKVTTRNVLYDAASGQTLLTSTQNGFNDPVYNFSYPAWWSYNRMGPASDGIMRQLNSLTLSATGQFPDAATEKMFVAGDELWLAAAGKKAWVAANGPASLRVIDAAGEFVSGTHDVTVIRSGCRNQQELSAGSVVSMSKPFNSTGTEIEFNSAKRIIDAKATEYSEKWQMPGTPPGCNVTSGACSDCGYSQEALLRFFNSMIGKLEGSSVLNNPDYCYYSLYRESGSPTIINCTGYNYSGVAVMGQGNCIQLQMRLTDPQGTIYALPACYRLNSTPGGHPSWNEIQGFDAIINNTIYFHWTGGQGTISILEECSSIYACQNASAYFGCYSNPAAKINPYVKGIRGNWRPLSEYVYTTDRFQNNNLTNDNTDIRNEGHYILFNPMWTANAGNDWIKNTTDTRWTWSEQSVRCDTYGNNVEAKDALGRYTTAVYGYAGRLVIAAGANALYKEVGYEGFEDGGMFQCPYRHFNFQRKIGSIEVPAVITSKDAHTGWYSAELTNDSLFMERCMTPKYPLAAANDVLPFYPAAADYLGLFSPHSGLNEIQYYVLSFWVKQENASGDATDYTNVSARVYAGGTRINPVFTKSQLIDGWQLITGEFSIPANKTGKFRLVLYNANLVNFLFDDVRIFPADATVKSFVYDYISGRHMATLDENNYATFYEYDIEGSVLRVKKETERGIYTIQQSTNNQAQP